MSSRKPIIEKCGTDPTGLLVVISVGSNLPSNHGDPVETVVSAIAELGMLFKTELQISSLWKTAPLDCPPDTPMFINAVVAFPVPSGSNPESMLRQLQRLESSYGRKRGLLQNAPRTLDLDLICWGELVSTSVHLILPHPGAHLRGFVLRPLAEISPTLILPGQTHTVLDLVAQLSDSNEIRIS